MEISTATRAWPTMQASKCLPWRAAGAESLVSSLRYGFGSARCRLW
jgi:hypothetical protein